MEEMIASKLEEMEHHELADIMRKLMMEDQEAFETLKEIIEDHIQKEKIMSELTKDLIQNALDQDFNKANQVFDTMMNDKMADLLDQAKVALAGQMFNGEEPEDEQLDLDFESDDDGGTDEEADAEDSEEYAADDETEVSDETEEEYEEDAAS